MLVSIITPAYNSSEFIGETIRSIQRQTFSDWELLITDDCSTDYTKQIAIQFAKEDSRIKVFELEKHSGAAAARNLSLKKASGRFIAFCDSDDLWFPAKLEKQIGFMMENHYAFSFTDFHVMSETGNPLGTFKTRPKVNYDDLLKTCDIGCLTAIYDTHVLGKIPMPDIIRRQDYGLWLKILKKTDFAYGLPETLGYYRLRSNSISRNKARAIYYIWRVYRDLEKIPVFESLSLIVRYSLYGMRKYSSLAKGVKWSDEPDTIGKPRLLFLVNVDWFFLSHRLPIALAAREAGFNVWVAAADTGKGSLIREHGLNFIPIPMSRSGTNIFSELRMIGIIFNLLRKVMPDLIHNVAIKPVLYGSIVSRLFYKGLPVVNAITGLGFVYSEKQKGSPVRWLASIGYRISLKNPRALTIFQNPDDRESFISAGLIPAEQTRLIRGSGVDCEIFTPAVKMPSTPLVLLASRMIYDKGVNDFVEVARIVKKVKPDVRFVLAGNPDEGNPAAVPISQLQAWNDEKVIEWWGHNENMSEVLRQSTMVVLPTFYPEGVPKILIEAAACELPIVSTNRSGCREIVRDGINGLLVAPHDKQALAEAVIFLLDNPEKASQFGIAGRNIVMEEFSLARVVDETLTIYKNQMGKKWPGNIT